MKEYLDKEDKKIEEDFYKLPNSDNLFYFTGRYEEGLAVFEKENEVGKTKLFPVAVVKTLCRAGSEEVKKELENLKDKVSWLEEKLKK